MSIPLGFPCQRRLCCILSILSPVVPTECLPVYHRLLISHHLYYCFTFLWQYDRWVLYFHQLLLKQQNLLHHVFVVHLFSMFFVVGLFQCFHISRYGVSLFIHCSFVGSGSVHHLFITCFNVSPLKVIPAQVAKEFHSF